jgi:hypothetical protein
MTRGTILTEKMVALSDESTKPRARPDASTVSIEAVIARSISSPSEFAGGPASEICAVRASSKYVIFTSSEEEAEEESDRGASAARAREIPAGRAKRRLASIIMRVEN